MINTINILTSVIEKATYLSPLQKKLIKDDYQKIIDEEFKKLEKEFLKDE
jgi:hypothetical protein